MPSKCLKIPKALWGFAHFWEFCSTLHGGSKNFFLRKVSKNKAEFNFELSETTFSGFSTFNTGNGPLVIWPCLKMLKIFETGFEIWCAKTAFGLLSAYLFVFGEIWHRLRPSDSAKSGQLHPNCLNFDGFFEDLLTFTLKIAISERKTFSKFFLLTSIVVSF